MRKIQRGSAQCLLGEHGPLQCDAPDRHACLQGSHGSKQRSKLNTAAWIVELAYLHVVVKCESLWSGYDKTHCTVSFPVFRFLRSSNSRICAGNCTVRVKGGLLCLQTTYDLFTDAINY